MRQNRQFRIVPEKTEPETPTPKTGTSLERIRKYYFRFHSLLLIITSVAITLTSIFIYDATRPEPQHLTQTDINGAVERALETLPPSPSFESEVYQIIYPSLALIHSFYLNSDGNTEGSIGTGVVVSDTGMILTCLHVVEGADHINVVFADGTESNARITGAQPENDLVVLQPELIPDDLLPATLGGGVSIGEEVVAVGNPFGMSNSLTAGVVSGLGRSFYLPDTGRTLTNLIQFDAAVNPGNSGGPLLNRDGEVVGIVTALLNPTEDDVFVGIGFAVTMETAGGVAGVPPV